MVTIPTRYDDAVYDNPLSIYEQAVVVQTENDDTLSSTVVSERIGLLVQTEENDTLFTAAGIQVMGDLIQTEEDDSSVITAVLPLFGSLVQTDEDDVLFSFSDIAITASLSVTEADDVMVSHGHRSVQTNTTGSGIFLYDINSGGNGSPYTTSTSIGTKPYEEN